MHLYKHQQDIIDADPKKCGLWLGTGSGKTRIALELAMGRVLVIAPKTQVEDKNWQRELIVLGLKYDDFVVISKETFRRDHSTLPAFDTVIVDEAHTCLGVTPNVKQRKGVVTPRTSQIFEALDTFLQRTKPERLYLCTATIVKSPMTVWGAIKLINPTNILVRDVNAFLLFRMKFYNKLPMPGREVWTPKRDSETKDYLARLVKDIGYVGRLEDFFDVPEQTFITKHIELTAAQKKRIKELPMEYPDPIVLIGKKHQVENGVLAGDEFSEPELFDSGKIEKILELAEEFDRMVIFCKYRAQVQQIFDAVNDARLSFVVRTMTGDTSQRGIVIAEMNAAKKGVFIVQAQISAGWELPEYPVMVFASRTYSYVDYAQAIGRIHRANALKKNLYINLVVKGGIDEAVDRALANKQSFDERLYLGI